MSPPSLAESIAYIHGGFRLFFLKRDALILFGDQPSDFWKSFWCAALLLPLHIWLFSDIVVPEGATPPGPFQHWGGELIGYVIQWVYWPLIVGHAVVAMKREDRFVPYVVAYNWAQAAPTILVCIPLIVDRIVPLGPVVELVGFGLLIWSVVFRIFLARVALAASRGMAAGLVAADFIIGFVVLELTALVVLSGM